MKNMRAKLFSVQVLGLSCLLAGCGGGALYDSQSWLPPADTEKATSDWDVASGICDKLALGTKLTEAEEARLEADKKRSVMELREYKRMANTVRAMQGSRPINPAEGGPTVVAAAAAIDALLLLPDFVSASTAEEEKKTKAFQKCMEKLDWKMKDDQESD